MRIMDHRAWIATRKGLFELQRTGLAWRITRVSFLGEPVTMLLPPQPDGRMLAALNLGHFGAKLHASDDAGATWQEVTTPAYPEQPADATGPAWKLVQVWVREPRLRPQLAAQSGAVGPAGPRRVDGRRQPGAGPAFGLPAPRPP
jgi:hypothetical protein